MLNKDDEELVLSDNVKSVIWLLKNHAIGWTEEQCFVEDNRDMLLCHSDTKIGILRQPGKELTQVLLYHELEERKTPQPNRKGEKCLWVGKSIPLSDFDHTSLLDAVKKWKSGKYHRKGGKIFARVTEWMLANGFMKREDK